MKIFHKYRLLKTREYTPRFYLTFDVVSDKEAFYECIYCKKQKVLKFKETPKEYIREFTFTCKEKR